MINRYITLNIAFALFSMCLYGVSTEEFKNAVENGETEMVRQMLIREQYLLQNVWPEAGEHAIHVAAQNGHVAMVILLHRHHVPLDQRDNLQQTALHKAVQYGRYEVVQYLLSCNSSLMSLRDAEDATPLYRAVEHGHSSIVSLLLDAGALVSLGTTQHTMLELAALKGHGAIFSKLFNVIGCLTVRNSPAFSSLFFHAIQGGSEEIVLFLIGQEADVNGRDVITRTPLHVAAIYGHTQLVRLLLRHGARADTPDETGRKALDIALSERRNSMINVLRAASPSETAAQAPSSGHETQSQGLRRLLGCFRPRR